MARVTSILKSTVGGAVGKGFWAIMDQGLFAMSNFGMNVLLARWLAPSDYGAFSLAFAVFLFVGAVHTALLTEPMLVFSQGRYREDTSEYLGTLFYGHLAFSVLGSLLLGIVACGIFIWSDDAVAYVMLALAATSPFILFLWLLRRACYARLEPHLAAIGGGIYLVVMLLGATVLYRFELLSSAAALGVMALSSAVVGIWLSYRLGIEFPKAKGEFSRSSLKNHWSYGVWAIPNRSINWFSVNMYYLILPILAGLAAGASFKALMNLTMPMLQTVSALTVLLLPMLVRARTNGTFGKKMRVSLMTMLAASILYWLLLGLFHNPIVSLIYGGRYMEYSYLLWILGFMPVLTVLMEVFSQAIRAMERPDRLLRAYASSVIVGIAISVTLMYTSGLFGAASGFLVARIVSVLFVILAFKLLLDGATESRNLEGEK